MQKENQAPSLEVFILTYNRADYLGEALRSVLNQTAQNFDIKILDNGSTDNTRAVAAEIQKEYPARPFEFLTVPKNRGPFENFLRAQKLASKDYVMLFHDDDVLHPEYIATAFKLLARHPGTVMLASACIATSKPAEKPWKRPAGKYLLLDSPWFATYLTAFKMHCFPSTIYQTKILKKQKTGAAAYGKIADRPLVMDMAGFGNTLMLKDRFIKYRTHPGQDSASLKTGPFEGQIIALLKKYKEMIQPESSKIRARLYGLFVDERLRGFHRWALRSSMTFADFRRHCVKENILAGKEPFWMKSAALRKAHKKWANLYRDIVFRKRWLKL